MAMTLQEISDRLEIMDLLTEYATAIDKCIRTNKGWRIKEKVTV